MDIKDAKIAVIGLAMSACRSRSSSPKSFRGWLHISAPRIKELRQGKDSSLEGAEELAAVSMAFTEQLDDLRDCNVYHRHRADTD